MSLCPKVLGRDMIAIEVLSNSGGLTVPVGEALTFIRFGGRVFTLKDLGL